MLEIEYKLLTYKTSSLSALSFLCPLSHIFHALKRVSILLGIALSSAQDPDRLHPSTLGLTKCAEWPNGLRPPGPSKQCLVTFRELHTVLETDQVLRDAKGIPQPLEQSPWSQVVTLGRERHFSYWVGCHLSYFCGIVLMGVGTGFCFHLGSPK